MTQRIKPLVAALALGLFAALAHAQATPAGLWKTIDDATKKEKSLVRISESGGVFSGKIEKLLDPATKPDALCDKCSDERKNLPVLGLTIIKNVKPSEDRIKWEGGEILDPNNGKTYKLRLTPMDGGKTLEVRGFVGPFYRNQVWTRVE